MLALFGVKLAGKDIISGNGRDKIRQVVGTGRNILFYIRTDVVTVDKIKPFTGFNVLPQGMGLLLMDLVPAHVRDLEGLSFAISGIGWKSPDLPGDDTETIHTTIFIAVIHERLQAKADPQKGFIADALAYDVIESLFLQACHALTDRSLPGKDNTISGQDNLRRITNTHSVFIVGNKFQRLGDRAQVAGSVIEDNDVRHGVAYYR